MSDCMEFPETWEEFEQDYGFEDREEVYTNGSRLIQSFRVKQWLDHTAEPERKKGEWIEYPDCLQYEGAYSDDDIVCSNCHHVFNILDNCTEEFDFCPHCGADMRGDHE